MTEVVAALTQSAIEDACAAAGAGGTVRFPNGTYEVDGLAVTHEDQTWLLDRHAVLKRTATTVEAGLTILAPGFRLRGGALDGNAGENPTRPGIIGEGFGADIREHEVRDAGTWGILIKDAPLTCLDVPVSHSRQGAVLWKLTGDTDMDGPHCERMKITRDDGAWYVGHGGIHVRSDGAGRHRHTRLVNNVVMLVTRAQVATEEDFYTTVGLECIKGLDPQVRGNACHGGRIGVSFGYDRFGRQDSNFGYLCRDYLNEVAQGSKWTNVVNNGGVADTWGTICSGASGDITISGQNYHGSGTPVEVLPGCANVIQRDNR